MFRVDRYCIKWLLVAIVALWGNSNSYAQQQENTTKIYFNLDKFDIVPSLSGNEESLARLDELLDKIETHTNHRLISIEIDGNCSPEAGRSYNQKLSFARANSIKDYIATDREVADSLITMRGEGIAWELLYTLVDESDMKYKDEVLWILTNVEEETWVKREGERWRTLVDSRLKHLMDLRGGKPYRYMLRELFPAMRNSGVVTITYSVFTPPILPEEPIFEELRVDRHNYPIPASDSYRQVPLLAIKTNLIYDAASALNLEVEVPVGERFSVTGELINPWWHIGSMDYTMRVHMGTVSGKYWFGNRDRHERLTGFAVGLNVGLASDYDVQFFESEGIQGTYFMAGVIASYAHRINNRWHLEGQIGLGVMESDYKNYTMSYGTDHGDIKVFDYPWATKRKVWFGPTQIRFSIAYMIYHSKKISR